MLGKNEGFEIINRRPADVVCALGLSARRKRGVVARTRPESVRSSGDDVGPIRHHAARSRRSSSSTSNARLSRFSSPKVNLSMCMILVLRVERGIPQASASAFTLSRARSRSSLTIAAALTAGLAFVGDITGTICQNCHFAKRTRRPAK